METVCLDNQPMMFLSDFCPTDCALNANKQLKINCLFCLKSGLGDFVRAKYPARKLIKWEIETGRCC